MGTNGMSHAIDRRRLLAAMLGAGLAAGCAVPESGGTTRGNVGITRYGPNDEARVQFAMLDSVNALRAATGARPLVLSPELNAAAKTHSIDMARQNRPWHFGSDGSSPIDRAQRAGFQGNLLGEAISETYESELETIAAWMQEPGPRRIILDPQARRMGFAFFQERNGKIWWTMVMGKPALTTFAPAS